MTSRWIHLWFRYFTLPRFVQIFVQCDSDLMLARRIKRDVKERGRNVEGVLDQYDSINSHLQQLNIHH